MLVTLEGIVTEVKPEQHANASSLMLVTPEGIATLVAVTLHLTTSLFFISNPLMSESTIEASQ